MWQRIKAELQFEAHRYSSTKYGKLAAVGIYFLIFQTVPYFLRIIVPLLSQHLSQEDVYLWVLLGTLWGTTLIYNLVMYFVYTLKVPFLEKYRCNPNKPWPWEENPQKWRKLMWRSIKHNAINQLIIIPLTVWANGKIGFNYQMDVFNPPSFIQMLPHLLFFQVMEDIMFFLSHRLLHFPFLYPYHKIHHQFTTTVTIAGLHSHFVEALLSNVISAGIYMKLSEILIGPIHINISIIWIILRMWDAYNGHCGYKFSWAPLQLLPFCCNDDYHDFHHSSNSGNYAGQFRLLDSLFGYNKDFYQHIKKRSLKQE